MWCVSQNEFTSAMVHKFHAKAKGKPNCVQHILPDGHDGPEAKGPALVSPAQ